RDARWGRVMEGAGEDSYYGALVAAARVQGFQGNLTENNLAACPKHYAGYGFAEGGRDYNTVDVSMQRLFNDILPPFQAAANAGALTFMNSFNTLNGVPATASAFLQRDILKGKWDFNGFIVSDWGSIREIMLHGYAADEAQAGQMAITAGSDMDMEGGIYVSQLEKLVKDGKVKESLIDDAVRRILLVKFKLGLFDNPYKYLDSNREKQITGSKEMHEAALDMAKKSIVLLKNDNNLLPLKKQSVRIALIGELAADKNSPLGSWRGAAVENSAVSVLEGMQKYTNNRLTYAKGTNVYNGQQGFTTEVKITPDNRSGFDEAINAAKNADVVVMVLGEYAFMTGEGRSRSHLDLPGNQQDLLKEILTVNKNVVLVLNNGRPLALEWEAANVPAIVEAWQLGTEAGNAIAQVLYGDYNPSGKLPMSFPYNVGQVPVYYNMLSTARGVQTDVFWSHYTDAPNTALFPFGYGLSYTTFEYKNLKVNKKDFAKGEPIKITVDLTNTGNYNGKEVAQLYLHDIAASIAQPVKKLKGFQLVELKKGETKTVEFTLTDKELGFYNNEGEYLVEPGKFTVFVGTSSAASLKADFNIME
ncbi:MAG: glycoside hydrolase family 3 C-terminal domain-containing protein, partial [Paludibacter sp.]|nr:glycoside hydrolase family 3 C-terminal domain-containing protein [Paludibacter sp.]